MLNPDSPIPLYRQLADLIEDRIRTGRYAVGSKIPSEQELARRYKIGRPTVRQATEYLVRSNKLSRKRGSGTFVKSPEEAVSLFSISGTRRAFHEKEIQIEMEMLQPVQRQKELQKKGHPFERRDVYTLQRRILHHQSPLLIENIFLLSEVFTNFSKFDVERDSIAEIVARNYYLKPSQVTQYFAVWNVPAPFDKLLGIKLSEPVLRVRRHVDFERFGTAVYAELFCRTDRFEYSQTIGG